MLHEPATVEGIVGNRYVLYTVGLLIVLQLLFTYLPPMQHLFGTVDLGLADWRNILVVATSVFVLVEIEKLILRRRKHEK